MKERPTLEYALHPVDDRLIHVDDYCNAEPAPSGWPRCPLCFDAVLVAPPRGRRRVRRFMHAAHGHARCPLVDDALPNPLSVGVGPPLDASAHAQRERFLAHWQRHLHTIRQTVTAFSVARFTRAIELADALRLWAWPRLAQRDVPYLLLVLTEFIAAPRGERHAAWLRFWFDASVQRVDDLNRPHGARPRLFRLRYRPPRLARFPNLRHLLDCHPVPMDDLPLNRMPVVQIPAADIAAFEVFMLKKRDTLASLYRAGIRG